ncbi:hypothetical protein KMP13_04340 [Epibacterium ulvae]|uniref:hypothetical protein n=1 Tax=Epibacterium ulvae TaxID=1156985 RepID=UPI001BFC2A7B|nr:hypothetical protein [Epibacterium ulvae]MBT8153130.1 hypothetical protein [Epibacterium ulvae]
MPRLTTATVCLFVAIWCYFGFATGVNVECGKLSVPAEKRLRFCKLAERFSHPLLTDHQLADALLDSAITLAELGKTHAASEDFKRSWHLQNPYRKEVNTARSNTIRRMTHPDVARSVQQIWRDAITESSRSK